MGIMVYSLLWVMQDFVHQPYIFVQVESWSLAHSGRRQASRVCVKVRGVRGAEGPQVRLKSKVLSESGFRGGAGLDLVTLTALKASGAQHP